MAKWRSDAGDYDKWMVLQEPTITTTKGTSTPTWAELAQMWCSLRPVRGREYWDARAVNATVTHIARTWYREDISPTSDMRMQLPAETTRTFQIESVINVDEANEEFEFRLTESV